VSEGYQAKKKRWLELAARLPPELKGRIALRNVEAASLLKPEAQQTLAKALDAGLRQVSAAIRLLRQQPDALVNDVLQEARTYTTLPPRLDSPVRGSEQPGAALPLAPRNGSPAISSLPGQATLPGADALAGLIQACFPDMPRISAEALAAAGLTASLRALLQAWQECLCSPQLTDLTFVILAGFVQQAQAGLQAKASEKPAYLHALRNSGVSLPNPERRT
jgi:hypothetical protein